MNCHVPGIFYGNVPSMADYVKYLVKFKNLIDFGIDMLFVLWANITKQKIKSQIISEK